MTPTVLLTRGRRWYGTVEEIFDLCRIWLLNDLPDFTQQELDGLRFTRGRAAELLKEEWQVDGNP